MCFFACGSVPQCQPLKRRRLVVLTNDLVAAIIGSLTGAPIPSTQRHACEADLCTVVVVVVVVV